MYCLVDSLSLIYMFSMWLGQSECNALMDALQQCTLIPRFATMLAKSLHRILQLAPEPTIQSFKSLNATSTLMHIVEQQQQVNVSQVIRSKAS